VPAFGAETKPIIDANKERLIAKYGIERGTRMTTRTRNMLIFPNTILNDVMSVSIRTAWPGPDEDPRQHLESRAGGRAP
jgi:p-cumate 2,3-dioxygenase alpha subunit